MVAGDEFAQVGALELVFLQSEVLVGPEIVDPELFGPRFLLGRLAVEEKNGDGLLNGAQLCSSAILRKSRNVNCST